MHFRGLLVRDSFALGYLPVALVRGFRGLGCSRRSVKTQEVQRYTALMQQGSTVPDLRSDNSGLHPIWL